MRRNEREMQRQYISGGRGVEEQKEMDTKGGSFKEMANRGSKWLIRKGS